MLREDVCHTMHSPVGDVSCGHPRHPIEERVELAHVRHRLEHDDVEVAGVALDLAPSQGRQVIDHVDRTLSCLVLEPGRRPNHLHVVTTFFFEDRDLSSHWKIIPDFLIRNLPPLAAVSDDDGIIT
jgi:hypothetical protein